MKRASFDAKARQDDIKKKKGPDDLEPFTNLS